MNRYECPVCLDLDVITVDGREVPCPVCRPDDHDDTEHAHLVHLAGRQATATWAEEHDDTDAYGWFSLDRLGWEAA